MIASQTTDTLIQRLESQIDELTQKTGLSRQLVLSQSFITPSCGTGSLDVDSSKKVLKMTKEVAEVFAV